MNISVPTGNRRLIVLVRNTELVSEMGSILGIELGIKLGSKLGTVLSEIPIIIIGLVMENITL
jgi:hypothetical protein